MKKLIVSGLILALMVPLSAFAAAAYNIGGNTPQLAPGNPASVAVTPRMAPPSEAGAGLSPIGLGLIPPLQFPPRDWDVFFVRVSVFWAINHNVCFFDVGGLGTWTTGDLHGFQVGGLWNLVEGSVGGVQVGGIGNYVGRDFTGVQVGGLINYQDSGGVFSGLQVGCVNVAGQAVGMQIGLVNVADEMSGMQIGVINTANNLVGLQIGLGNVVSDSVVSFMPILNFGF